MKLQKKANRRPRPDYYAPGIPVPDAAGGLVLLPGAKLTERADGAQVYQAAPSVNVSGNHQCRCGRTVSANKEICAACK